MRVVKHDLHLPIINHDTLITDGSVKIKRHGELFPSNIRALVCAPSAAGKTNILLSLLTHRNGIRFNNLYIFSKSLNQPKYRLLFEILEPLKDIGVYLYNTHEDIDKLENVKPNSVFICDDVVCSPQNEISDYFCRSRHNNIDCFFLTQTYTMVQKRNLRDNCNFIIILKQDLTNMKHIYNDFVIGDMSFEKFKEMCNLCWTDAFGFLVIDRESELNKGRYRKSLDSYIIL